MAALAFTFFAVLLVLAFGGLALELAVRAPRGARVMAWLLFAVVLFVLRNVVELAGRIAHGADGRAFA
ncbi:hypothetical protein [Caulobacter sp. 17J65-9]|uniref:hypothetical protein n=1 Tax=Caulobacter sp. 17J65-9 TaxID=2709382 RepID=UPI0013CD889F|nr:hypothetical protein [Caulobacter sp. 17J65-9]NEX95125.1 hypothetical protein [Caulobacter sp. 17J65-9]